MSAEAADAASLPSPENGAHEDEVKPEATGLNPDPENGTGDDQLEAGDFKSLPLRKCITMAATRLGS